MSIGRSSLIFSFGTILSRLSGLVRDMILSAVFGASVHLDAFFVAQRVPTMLREMLAEGSLGSAFTKVYTDTVSNNAEKARELLHDVLFYVGMFAFLLSAAGVVFAPYVVDLMTILTKGTPKDATLIFQAHGLARILFPMLGVFILGAVTMGTLHQQGRFLLTSVAPVCFNLGWIVGALVLGDYFVAQVNTGAWAALPKMIAEPQVTGLAVGVLLGACTQVGLQFVGIRKNLVGFLGHVWRRLRGFGRVLAGARGFFKSPLGKILLLMAPMTLAASSGQINQLVNTMYATSLEDGGTVSWLSYAFRLLHLPIAVFGVAISAAALPALTREIAKNDGVVTAGIAKQAQRALELVLWLMVPCWVFYLVNHQDVVRLLFESGAFSNHDTTMTANALFAYSFGLVAFGALKVLTSFYFALDRTSYAMKVSFFGVFVNFGVIVLVVQDLGHVGLAAALSTTLTVNASLLVFGLRREAKQLDHGQLLRTILALGCGGVAVYALQWGVLSMMEPSTTRLDAAVRLIVAGVASIVGFAGLLSVRYRAVPLKALQALLGR